MSGPADTVRQALVYKAAGNSPSECKAALAALDALVAERDEALGMLADGSRLYNDKLALERELAETRQALRQCVQAGVDEDGRKWAAIDPRGLDAALAVLARGVGVVEQVPPEAHRPKEPGECAAERWPCGCVKGETPHGAGWSDCEFAKRADSASSTGRSAEEAQPEESADVRARGQA